MTASWRVVEKVVHVFALSSNPPRSGPLITDMNRGRGSSKDARVTFGYVVDEFGGIVADENLVYPFSVPATVPPRRVTFRNVVAKVSSKFGSQSNLTMEPFLDAWNLNGLLGNPVLRNFRDMRERVANSKLPSFHG